MSSAVATIPGVDAGSISMTEGGRVETRHPSTQAVSKLDPRLVDEDLGPAIRAALDDPAPGYAERAAELLEPFSPAAVDRTVGDRVLPRLLEPR